jgi:hypothetical protein
MTLESFQLILEKPTNIKSHKNPSEGLSCSVRTDRRADMTKLRVAFRNFTNKAEIRITQSLLIAGCSLCKERHRYVIATDTAVSCAVIILSQPSVNILPNVRKKKLLSRVQLLACPIRLIP